MGRWHDVGHHPAHAAEQVHRWEMAPLGQPAGQHDVAVEARARRIYHRVGEIVALGQGGVHGGDAAHSLHVSGALHQTRQQGKHRRRIAARGGRLAGGQPDFPLGHRDPGERVEQQEHALAMVAKVLGHCRGAHGGAHPHERRLVPGGHHDHGTAQTLAQIALHELAHLAAALAH